MTAGLDPSETEVFFGAATLERLLKINQSLLIIQEPTALLEQIADDAQSVLGADVVVLYVYEEKRNDVMVPPVIAGTLLTGEVLRTTSKERPHRESAVFKMLHQREPFYAENAREDWPRSLDGWSWEGSFLQREDIASSAAIPLTANEKTAGVLFINYRKPRTFGESARRVIELFASSAAIAIRNARFLHDERTLRQEAETLRQVAGTIGSAVEMDKVKNQILDGLARIVQYETASLQIVRGDYRTLLAGRGFSTETASRYLVRPISKDPLIKRIVQSQKPLILSHPEQDPDWERRPDTVDVKSWLGIPLIYNREVIGLLTADHSKPGFYKEESRDALVTFADKVAVAVRNARIFDSAQRRIRDLEIINDVTELMATKLDPEDLLKTLVSQVAQRLECTHCTIFFPKDQDGETYLVPEETHGERSAVIRTRRFRLDEGLAGWVYQHGESLVLGDAKEDERFAAAREEEDRPRSMLVVPVQVGDRTIGVISADQDEYGWFGESEQRLLDALARQAGIAIERATGLKILQDIGHRILSAPKEDEILCEVVQGALELTHTTSGVIYLIGKDGRSVTHAYQYPDDFDHPPPRMDSEDGITRQVIRDGQVRTFKDVGLDKQVNPVLRDRKIRSMIALPMISGNTVIGVLYLNDVQPHQFTDTEISLLTTLASQAAIAIRNAQLLKESKRLLEGSRRQADELLLLQQVSSRLMTLDLDELLSFIIQGAMDLTQTESGFIYLLDGKAKRITESVAYPPDAPYPKSRLRKKGLARHLVKTGEPVFISDTSQDERVHPAIVKQGIQCFLAQPLKEGNRVLGVLYLNDQSLRTFSPEERSLVQALADQAAVAIYNASLFKESQRLSEGHQTLNSVGTKLMGMLDEKEILQYVARSAADTLLGDQADASAYTHCTVFRKQEDKLVVQTSQGNRDWSMLEGRGFDLGQGIAGWVAKTGRPELVRDSFRKKRFQKRWSEPQPDPRSLVVVPIPLDGGIYGVISAEHDKVGAFDPYDLQLLETLASQAGQALQNAQLFATRQRLETQLESLHEVVQEQNLEIVLGRIVEGIRAILGEGISPTINLYNEQAGEFTHCQACGPLKEALQVPPRPGGTGRHVIETGEPLYLPDVHDLPSGVPKVRRDWIGKGIQSFAAIPLKREEHIVGVLYVNAQNAVSFSPEIRRVLELFAGQAATAIENARLYQDLKRRIDELKVLTEIGRTVSQLGVDQILDLVYQEMGKIMDLSDAQVEFAFYDEAKDEVSFPLAVEQTDGFVIDRVRWAKREAGYREPGEGELVEQFRRRARRDPPGLSEYVIRTQEPLMIVESFEQKAAELGIQISPKSGRLGRPTGSWLGVPMMVGGRVTGVISLRSLGQEYAFDQDHVQVLAAVANQAAIAIENARLYTEMEKRVRERTDQLLEARRKLEATDKLALASQIGSHFAHRINNLVGTIEGRANYVRRFLGSMVEEDHRAIKVLDGISDDIKLLVAASDVLREDTGPSRVAVLDVGKQMHEARKRVSRARVDFEKVSVQQTADGDLYSVLADEIQIAAILENLISNAVDAMPDGGHLGLTARNVERLGQRYVELTVSDSGIGIAEEEQKYLFELFYTTKETGLGFGLWHAQVYLRSIGGDIQAASQLGEGAAFTILLPASREEEHLGHETRPVIAREGS